MGIDKVNEPAPSQAGARGEFDPEKLTTHEARSTELSGSNSETAAHESDSDNFQDGVQRVRVITTIWSKKTLLSMFCLLYLVLFVDYMQNSIDSTLNPYITSSFGAHGLLNIGSILSSIIGACAPLALAKVIDIWGRIEGYFIMLMVCIIGMILKATCNSVQMYVGAHVMYWTGHIGILYVIDVMVSDMTTLRNRMIVIGINGTPRIVATFAGAPVAQLFYERSNFRWAFGAFAIILFAFSLPAMGLMIAMFRKALAQGLFHKEKSNRTFFQSLKYYFIELDVTGIILIIAALSCLLLPYSLAPYAPNYWTTPYIIAIVVLGVVLLPIFYIWEAKFAPVQFLPFKYLKQGTIIGSCLLNGLMFLSTFTWNAYYGSYLQVVHRLSMTNSQYVLNSYALTAAVFAPFIGWWISYSGNFKWTAYAGVPIMLLGTALIIPFRAPSTNPGVLALTQILVGLGSAFFTTCSSLAIMAPVTHQQLAVVNALSGLFGGTGAAIGIAIAGAFWNNMLPVEMHNRLPDSAKDISAEIFGDIVKQMSYPDGSPERQAIIDSYAHVMRLMVIVGACFMPLCLASIWVWRNINVRKLEEEQGKQTKGMVF